MRRRFLFILGYLVALALVSVGAATAGTFGSLYAEEGGTTLSQAGGGSVYKRASTSIGADMTFKDSHADGDGAYFEGYFQAWDKVTAPRCCTYYTWAWSRSKQTNRYGVADGWRYGNLYTGEDGITRWRGLAKICVDQGWQPDPCGKTGFFYPFG